RGLFLPTPIFKSGFGAVEIALLVGILGAIVFRIWARKRQEHTGRQAPVLLVTLALVIGLPLAVFFLAGLPLGFEFPQAGRFNITGGTEVLPEFIALLFGLSIYAAAFIAEVVRAGILAVAGGQTEAAFSRGLGPGTAPAVYCGSSGHGGNHPAAHKPVPQFDQEFLACGRDRLSRPGAGFYRHGAQSDRAGGGGRCDHDARLSRDQSHDFAPDEHLQQARGADRAVRASL